MTRDDAMRLLGITANPDDPAAIHEAYTPRAAAASQSVASASSPALRAEYEQQAERLQQARDLLLGRGRPGSSSPEAMSRAVMTTLEACPEARQADMPAMGRALEVLSGSLRGDAGGHRRGRHTDIGGSRRLSFLEARFPRHEPDAAR